MKLNYKTQMVLTIALIIVFNLFDSTFDHWIFSSVGTCLAGLLWVVHPVMVDDEVPTARQKLLLRFTGVFLILLGVCKNFLI